MAGIVGQISATVIRRISHYVVGRQRTRIRGGPRFDLYGDVTDVEFMLDVMHDIGKKIVAWMAGRHYQVCRQRGFRSAHRPDMQIMHFTYTWQAA